MGLAGFLRGVTVTTEVSKSKALIVTAWTFLLLSSALPRIILQEAFKYPVSNQLATAIPAVMIVLGLVLTFIWDTVRDLRRFLVTLVILAALFMLKKHPSSFFLVKGEVDAPAEAVRPLGIKAGEPWNR